MCTLLLTFSGVSFITFMSDTLDVWGYRSVLCTFRLVMYSTWSWYFWWSLAHISVIVICFATVRVYLCKILAKLLVILFLPQAPFNVVNYTVVGDGKASMYFKVDQRSGIVAISRSLGEDDDLSYTVSIILQGCVSIWLL